MSYNTILAYLQHLIDDPALHVHDDGPSLRQGKCFLSHKTLVVDVIKCWARAITHAMSAPDATHLEGSDRTAAVSDG